MQSQSVLMSSESSEWYTPQHIIDAALAVLGEVDLDPCSNSHANPIVPAKMHYTIEDDGLSLPWHGRVYMNPPYGRKIKQWVKKLCDEIALSHCTSAIVLTPARTDTAWFRRIALYPICFVRGRLKFSGHKNSAPFPSAIFGVGVPLYDFYYAFCGIGDIYELVEM